MIWVFYSAMMVIVALSNYLVQFPLNDWLTLGAFSYPISFLVTEVTNNHFGPKKAREVVYCGFLLGLILSYAIAPLQITIASGLAFLISQLLDITIFSKVRNYPAWWAAPFSASFVASAIDTAIFFSIAFYGENVPLITWALGDFFVKVGIDLTMLLPFRLLMRPVRSQAQSL